MFYINQTEPWLGEIPSSRYPTPEGPFQPRSSVIAPQLVRLVDEGHLTACHYPELVGTNLARQVQPGAA